MTGKLEIISKIILITMAKRLQKWLCGRRDTDEAVNVRSKAQRRNWPLGKWQPATRAATGAARGTVGGRSSRSTWSATRNARM